MPNFAKFLRPVQILIFYSMPVVKIFVFFNFDKLEYSIVNITIIKGEFP
jgi:hypothetical protein